MIIKVCGMREADNIREVERCGVDWMGFICYNRSPRYVESVPHFMPQRAMRVGVFVNAGREEILQKAESLGLNMLQLHGNESPQLCRQLTDDGYAVIKAFSIKTPDDVKRTADYEGTCRYFLFDTPCPGYGGSGKCFDWDILSEYKGDTPFLLSGGLKPTSLPALAAFSHPKWAGIDLNSGFETAPAQKDADALNSFIEQFKNLPL